MSLVGFIRFVLAIVKIDLGLRFTLRLFGANPATPFVRFIYDASEPLLQPFRGIFQAAVVGPGYVLEFSTLFAIIVYSLLAYMAIRFVIWLNNATHNNEAA